MKLEMTEPQRLRFAGRQGENYTDMWAENHFSLGIINFCLVLSQSCMAKHKCLFGMMCGVG